MTVAQIWDVCTKVMWDESYVIGLERFFRSKQVTTVLDVAGGTGFPSINLKRDGWDVSYADASQLMLSFFKERAAKEQIGLPMYLTDWQSLTKVIPSKFDAVLCRGNSLVYVDSWDSGVPSETVREHIKSSLKEFYSILNDRGLVYIDIFNRNEFGRSQYPFVEEFSDLVVDGNKIHMLWEVDHDSVRSMRTVKIALTINGEKFEHTLNSLLLRHEDLVDLIKDSGFPRVEWITIEGEKHYDVLVGYK